MKFAPSTTHHKRSVRPAASQEGLFAKGSIAVTVLSVNNCIRPRITIRKPIG